MFRVLWVFIRQTWINFSRDNCPQHAAAISYYVLFSIVPVLILTVSIVGFVLTDQSRRDDLADQIIEQVPLSETRGREAVNNALNSVQAARGPVAALGIIGTLWTSSAVFAATRRALNAVWKTDEHRPWARGKLVDFLQVGLLCLILLSSIALTGVLSAARQASADWFGPFAGNNALWGLPPLILPALLTFVTFILLYKLVPASHPAWRDVLPGALFGVISFEILKNAFAIYVANFNNYDVVYGSLAGALLFLLLTYLAANILLAGAELSRTFQRYHAGELEQMIHPIEPQPSVMEQTIRAFKGLFIRQS